MAINDDGPNLNDPDADYGQNDYSDFQSGWRTSESMFYCTGCNHRARTMLEIFVGDGAPNHAVYFCEKCIERMWRALTTERVKRRLLKGVGFAGEGRLMRNGRTTP